MSWRDLLDDSWAFLDDARDRLRRKPKPVVYLDLETCVMDPDKILPHQRAGILAYRVGDRPVQIVENSS